MYGLSAQISHRGCIQNTSFTEEFPCTSKEDIAFLKLCLL